MTGAGLPVPPGFTISTEACARHEQDKSLSHEIETETEAALVQVENLRGERLGGEERLVLVAIRSGARVSMPRLMDTILK